MINRVEKYRPNTLDDVEGHQDILATINKFVDTNVHSQPYFFARKDNSNPTEITAFTTVRSAGNWQDLNSSSPRTTNIRQQKYASDGLRAQRFRRQRH